MFSVVSLLLAFQLAAPAIENLSVLKTRKGDLLFVPASTLNEKGSSDLEQLVPQGSWPIYRRLLQRHGVSQGAPTQCLRPPVGDAFPPPGAIPQERTFVTEIRNNPVAVMGQIIGLTPGWHFDSNGVATLVRLRIDEVFKDSTEELTAGHTVTYLQPGGMLRIGARTICTRDPEYVSPKIGNRVILMGVPDASNELHVLTHPSLIYYVSDESVISGQSRPKKPARLSVDDVRAAARP